MEGTEQPHTEAMIHSHSRIVFSEELRILALAAAELAPSPGFWAELRGEVARRRRRIADRGRGQRRGGLEGSPICNSVTVLGGGGCVLLVPFMFGGTVQLVLADIPGSKQTRDLEGMLPYYWNTLSWFL